MTHATLEREPQGPPNEPSDPSADRVTPHRVRRRLAVPIALQLLAMAGIGALVYSSAADWFATINHNAEVSGYTESVNKAPSQDLEHARTIAQNYNEHMPQGTLRDPYTTPAPSEQGDEDGDAYALYEELLRVQGTTVMGELTYPRLGIGLPVYHGTSDDVLTKGAGHLYGSSLPIGGPSTHSVLTSHSGLVHANLFTDLPKAKIGDTFTVQVLGETHWYKVDQIDTVLPEETEGLRIVDGHDYVTLITCTPTGINSHRLLVRGERIAPPAESSGREAIAGDGKHAGIPWWVLIFTGGSAATAYLLFAPPRPKKATP
ncbi:class C sortase [Leucobacter sp. HY1908]